MHCYAQQYISWQQAASRQEAEHGFDSFEKRFGAKHPKAVECLRKDRNTLLTFYDFPAEHWTHIRTTNVIESSFATIRHRTNRANGCVTRTTMLTMIYASTEARYMPIKNARSMMSRLSGHVSNRGSRALSAEARVWLSDDCARVPGCYA